MSSVKLKVCGMKQRENILEVATLNPDFMGFIFYANSPRYVGGAFKMPAELSPTIKRVGVFVNESTERMLELSMQHQLEFVQLHGDETPGQCRQLKEQGLKVIKAFAVDESFDFKSLPNFEPFVDYFLFDTKGAQRGGNGIPFDWRMLTNYKSDVPFLLSGGIDPVNVGKIPQINNSNLFAIDVNSGVEESPGIKSVHKLAALQAKIRKLKL